MAQWTVVWLIVLVCSGQVLRVLLAKIQGARRAAMPREPGTGVGAMGAGCAGCNQCSNPCSARPTLATAATPAKSPKTQDPQTPVGTVATVVGTQATYQVLQFQPLRSTHEQTH